MNCTHPVLYADERGLYCHVCKARMGADSADKPQTNKNPSAAEKPAEGEKKPAQRRAKKTT